jgi:hypothetical protein
MTGFLKAGLGLLMAAAMATPSLAQSADVTGMWHPDKSSDWLASLCGDDNTQLCITVVGLRDHMDTDKNRPYLNKVILDHAKLNGKNRWKGKLHLFGQTGDAFIALRSANNLDVKVCIYVVLCKEYPMTRQK